MQQSAHRSELKTRGYLFLAGTILGAAVGFAAGIIVAWRVWLKLLHWMWERIRRVAGRELEEDQFDFQTLIQ